MFLPVSVHGAIRSGTDAFVIPHRLRRLIDQAVIEFVYTVQNLKSSLSSRLFSLSKRLDNVTCQISLGQVASSGTWLVATEIRLGSAMLNARFLQDETWLKVHIGELPAATNPGSDLHLQ